MAVYVDDVQHPFRGMIMCHMWADTLGELLHVADRLGLRREWLQAPPKASWIHFDVSLGMKRKAIEECGAMLVDRYGPVEHAAKLDVKSGQPDRVARGERMLEMIKRCRKMRKERPVNTYLLPRAGSVGKKPAAVLAADLKKEGKLAKGPNVLEDPKVIAAIDKAAKAEGKRVLTIVRDALNGKIDELKTDPAAKATVKELRALGPAIREAAAA